MSQALIDMTSADCDQATEAWEQIRFSLAKYRHLFLFIDFDGTLSELATVPSAARLDAKTKEVLKRLSADRRITIAVLSGRSVSDFADRVGLPIIYVGDLGLEIHSPDFEYFVPGADSVRLQLPAICNEIRQSIRDIPGALVEAKRLTASVHYRQVQPEHVAALRDAVNRCVDPFRFEVRVSKCVFEIRPRLNWNKGDAVEWILQRYGGRAEQAICMGDDDTDEDMFHRVARGINIRVLDDDCASTAAPYRIRQRQVANFLVGVLDTIHGVQEYAVATTTR
jgi:trehalose-phosphatase